MASNNTLKECALYTCHHVVEMFVLSCCITTDCTLSFHNKTSQLYVSIHVMCCQKHLKLHKTSNNCQKDTMVYSDGPEAQIFIASNLITTYGYIINCYSSWMLVCCSYHCPGCSGPSLCFLYWQHGAVNCSRIDPALWGLLPSGAAPAAFGEIGDKWALKWKTRCLTEYSLY